LNGDGFDDLVFGEREEPIAYGGAIYIHFGRPEGWEIATLMNDADASYRGYPGTADRNGYPVAAGDTNGDGLADLLIGDPDVANGGYDHGVVYLFLGRTSGWEEDGDLVDNTISFIGEAADGRIGTLGRIHGTGDINGDGLDDFLIGAPISIDASVEEGEVFLVFGRTSGWVDGMDLGATPQSFVGEDSDEWACEVGGGGDVDGDGYDDFIVGATGNHEAGTRAGKIYVILGGPWLESLGSDESLNTYAAVRFLGENSLDDAGSSVSIVQDVDGDGYDDLLIGAYSNSENGANAGKTYLIRGQSSGWASSVSLSDADASFLGSAPFDYFGEPVESAGDVNSDGYGDFLLGAPQNEKGGLWAGQVYLFLGRPLLWPVSTTVSEADASLVGEGQFDELHLTSGLGDLDGDGFGDVLVGTPYNGDAGHLAGKSYLILGHECWDVDWDGHGGCEDDCDDYDANVVPGGPEVCDGKDSDCDGTVPADEVDADGDSSMVCEGDCDDADPSLNVEDLDGDAFDSCSNDCDDADPETNPGAAEQCDGVDNDCDGVLPQDEVDGDGDGYIPCWRDCDDTNADIHPFADEICDDGIDNDCDEDIDDEDWECWETDDDDDDSASDDDSADDDDDPASDDDSADGDDVTSDDDTQTGGSKPPESEDCNCRTTPGLHHSSSSVLLLLILAICRRARGTSP
jgi:hypothetical protein